MTTSFPKRGIDRRSMPAAVLAVLLSLGVAQPSTAAPADRATVTFDLPAATPGATIAVCRNALKPDALIRAFEAHPALSTEARRFESAEAIRAHLTANRVATIGLTTSDCSRDAPTSETACIVLPASNAIFEIRMSGNDGDLEKSFRIIGYRPELMQGDVPRTNEGRFAVIDVGYVMARTARSDRVTCVTAKNWSAKPSHQVVQLRYGDPGDAPPNRR